MSRTKFTRVGMMSQSELVVLIIVMLSLVAVLLVLGRIYTNLAETADLTCGAQVREANFRNEVFGRTKALEIPACQPQYTTIKRSDLPSNAERADLALKKRLADSMTQCWRNWGAGEMDLFNGPGEYCAICEDIKFDDALLSEYQRDIPGFSAYLASTDAPGTNPPQKYIEVLTGKVVDDGTVTDEMKTLEGIELDPNQGLTIMYAHNKQKTAGVFLELENWRGIDIDPQSAGEAAGFLAASAELFIGFGKVKAAATAANEAKLMANAAKYYQYPSLITEATALQGRAAVAAGKGGLFAGGARAIKQSSLTGGAVTAGVYWYLRSNEEFTVTSATYITPTTADNKYVTDCKTLGAPLTSP